MKFREFRKRFIPDYAVVPYLICGIGLLMAFYLTRFINYKFRGPYETFPDITGDLDRAIPVIPLWVTVYFLSYVFWVVSYLWVSKESKGMSNRLLMADILCKILCTVIFIAFPTTMLQPENTDSLTAGWMLDFLYAVDSPDNLFPSMHCTTSWFAMRYVFKCKKIPSWYKWFSVFAVLSVFAAVLFTKQHVIVDIFGGVAAAEICIQISNRTNLYKLYDRLDITEKEKWFI